MSLFLFLKEEEEEKKGTFALFAFFFSKSTKNGENTNHLPHAYRYVHGDGVKVLRTMDEKKK
jgi:hypothetical protein